MILLDGNLAWGHTEAQWYSVFLLPSPWVACMWTVRKPLIWFEKEIKNIYLVLLLLRKCWEKGGAAWTLASPPSAEVRAFALPWTWTNIYCLCNPESCGHMCSYLDRGLKNEDRQQTNRTRHTNCVMVCWDYWKWAVRYPVERNISSPVATACDGLLSLGTPCMPAELKEQ